jgi:hypothetical protein
MPAIQALSAVSLEADIAAVDVIDREGGKPSLAQAAE